MKGTDPELGYHISWYYRTDSSSDIWHKLTTGANRTSWVKLDEGSSQLVHVFDHLKGRKVAKGAFMDKDLKTIKQVVQAGKDALANNSTRCGKCKHDNPDERFVQCQGCSCWRHVGCAEPVVLDEDEWWCSDCERRLSV